MCGGNAPLIADETAFEGPSPRVRGKRMGHCETTPQKGSIPACAGETARGARLRGRANGAHVLLLMPASQLDESGLATVMLSLGVLAQLFAPLRQQRGMDVVPLP